MANDDKPRSTPSLKSKQRDPRPERVAPAPRPFDMWLQKQLHAMYDEIASEPLPGDLLKLIDTDAARTADPPRAAEADPPSPAEPSPGKPAR